MTTPTITKETICDLLRAWIAQRPGLEYMNYGNPTAYRAEMRGITKDLHDARELLAVVESSGISADELRQAFKNGFSGRLTLEEYKPGEFRLDYCTGQYWPTEYRAAACSVLASALWNYYREDFAASARPGESAGDAIRRKFSQRFGRGIQSRWFD